MEIGVGELVRISEIMGITQIRNVTRLYCVNPTVTITRKSGDSEVVDCGKGLNLEYAFYSALFESMERFSATTYDAICCEETAEELSTKNILKPSDIFPKKKEKDNVIRKWCKGWNLYTNEEILVPYECVTFPTTSDFYNLSTVGLASGSSRKDAILHSIYEVIEHDTLNTTLYSGLPYQQILLRPEDGMLYEMKEAIIRKGVNIQLIRLMNNYKVPTVLALFRDIPGIGGNNVAGMGSSLDIRVAIRRAITEAEQSACFWNEKYDNDDMEETQEYHPILKFDESNYGIEQKNITINQEGLCREFDSTEQELQEVLEHLQSSTNQIIVVDITNQELGYPVVKTIIPEFEDCMDEEFLKQRSITIKRVIGDYIKIEK